MNILKIKSVSIAIATAALLLIQSCGGKTEGPTFTIKGNISNADGKMLYLTNIGIEKSTIIDSVKIGKDGRLQIIYP